jgi:hypothetical protein
MNVEDPPKASSTLSKGVATVSSATEPTTNRAKVCSSNYLFLLIIKINKTAGN